MSLKITKAGLLDTVQDIGRYGYQHLGINPGGAMDRFSASLANALLGKDLAAPVIELHFPASTFLFTQPSIICLTGADFTPTINGTLVPLNRPLFVNEETALSFTRPINGARCYLSLLNELLLQKWLGSYSTNLKASAGGYKGRQLQKGDELNFASLEKSFITSDAFTPLPWHFNEAPSASNDIGFIPGHEWNWLDTKSQTAFLNDRFAITPAADRMGYRLQGNTLTQNGNEQLVSPAVSFGTVQLLPSGQLIVLMADHQTTGGYPRVAHIISAHLSTLAQKKPGEEIKFEMTGVGLAEEKYAAQQEHLKRLQNTCNLKIQNWINAH
jgi:antagonist of KipI